MSKWFSRGSASGARIIPKVDTRERVYAVGDIHGCQDLLENLFEKIVEDAKQFDDGRIFRAIFLGDYIDRGDNSLEALNHLKLISESLPGQTEFLMGNHEAALLDFLEHDSRGASWVEMGGRQTLGSFGIQPPTSRDDTAGLKRARRELRFGIRPYMPFLKSLRKIVRSGDMIFAHAGLDPERALSDQPDRAVLWGNSEFLSHKGRQGLKVVHGHYANFDPVVLPHRICVDTGAYYSGKLTAIRLDDGEKLISVDRMSLPDTTPQKKMS